MLNAEIKHLSPQYELHIIDIQKIDKTLKKLLDSFLVSICEGSADSELTLVKTRFLNFLEDKTDITQMGAVAEFFAHLYLKTNNYKQEFLFFNLEEGSIKKGFDGFYSKNSETYLLESKSGSISSKSITHKNKLKEAYSDLAKYVSGKSDKGKNNPWKNAYNHASHSDVGTAKTIKDKIKKLQNLFDLKKFSEIKEFNIIPCSTIFLDGSWSNDKNDEILYDNDFILKFDANSVTAICVTKSSLNTFINYLRK